MVLFNAHVTCLQHVQVVLGFSCSRRIASKLRHGNRSVIHHASNIKRATNSEILCFGCRSRRNWTLSARFCPKGSGISQACCARPANHSFQTQAQTAFRQQQHPRTSTINDGDLFHSTLASAAYGIAAVQPSAASNSDWWLQSFNLAALVLRLCFGQPFACGCPDAVKPIASP